MPDIEKFVAGILHWFAVWPVRQVPSTGCDPRVCGQDFNGKFRAVLQSAWRAQLEGVPPRLRASRQMLGPVSTDGHRTSVATASGAPSVPPSR